MLVLFRSGSHPHNLARYRLNLLIDTVIVSTISPNVAGLLGIRHPHHPTDSTS